MVRQVCQRCGSFSTDGPVRSDGPGWAVVTCPACAHYTRIRRLPLFVLTGASGTGKTSISELLLYTFPDVVVLESDVLLAALRSFADEDIQHYWNLWLGLVLHVHQAGKPVLLCGTVQPRHLETAPDRDGIEAIHYVALTCDDAELQRRLRDRPAWRRCDDAFIASQVSFNRWWRDREWQADVQVEGDLLDTTTATPRQTAETVRAWVRERLPRR